MPLTKQCTKCKDILDATKENFHAQANGKYGLTSKCKKCKSVETRKWADKNPEKRKQQKIRWRELNREKYLEVKRLHQSKRRAMMRSLKNSGYSESEVLTLYGTNCHLCNLPIDLKAPRNCIGDNWQNGLHIDHVVGLAQNGEDVISNVRPAHALCNTRKNKRPLVENNK